MKVCVYCGQVIQGNGWRCPGCDKAPELAGDIPLFAKESAEDYYGYDATLYEELSQLEESNFWFRSRNELIIYAIKKWFPQAGNFLEIGCGTGFVLSHIARNCPSMTLYGSEIYLQGIEYARKRVHQARFFQMDARNIPFESEFELIGIFDCLEHIEEDMTVLKQMNKALCPRGGLVITVPQHPFLWSTHDIAARHVRRYTFSDLKAKINDAGFQIIYQTSFMTILFPLIVIARILKNRLSKENDPLAELKLNRYVNLLFEKLMGMERKFITSIAGMPFGSSLLIAARKL
jgi:SAM-dependent methyltransferase